MDADRGALSLDERARRRAVLPEEAAELTDMGNAARFVAAHGADAAYHAEWGWCVWDGTAWRRDQHLARGKMIKTVRAIRAEAGAVTDKTEQKEIAGWARRSQSAQRVAAALWLAEVSLTAAIERYDTATWSLPCPNGTVDLRTGDIYPHRREDYHTRQVQIPYDPSAAAPLWEAFLARVLPDEAVRAFVQRAVGYSLTGEVSEQVLFFVFGLGANGKSVFLESLAALFGEFHRAIRAETLSRRTNEGVPNDIAALVGVRLGTGSEIPEGSRLNESLAKDLTGGDTVSARFMRQEFFDFKPRVKLWMRGNHKPQIRGTDDGIWRRVLLIPFTEQIPPEERDRHLPEKLREELSGILAWAVRGCLDWQHQGLAPPAALQLALADYREEMDVFGAFLEECAVVNWETSTKATELYRAYKRWADQHGHPPVSSTRFGLWLAERGFRKHKRGVVWWQGIGLQADRGIGLDSMDSLDG